MIGKRAKLSKIKIKNILALLIMLIIFILFIPIPYYIIKPGTTEDLKNIIKVNNNIDNDSGAFYLTTVNHKKSCLLTVIRAKLTSYETVISQKELMGAVSESQYMRLQKYYFESSQNNAIEQALKLAQIPYKKNFIGVYALNIFKESNFYGKILVGDTVISVNGEKFKSSKEYIEYVTSKKVGQEVTATFIQNGTEKDAKGKLIASFEDKKAVLGFEMTDHFYVYSSIPIKFNSKDIGGPSAGLMFTLEIYEQLSHKKIRKGYHIAGTGTIDSDGSIGQIGYIDKKVISASKNGADIFFAPDYEVTDSMKKSDPKIKNNYDEAKIIAKKINTKMKIIPVKTIHDSLEYLNTLKDK